MTCKWFKCEARTLSRMPRALFALPTRLRGVCAACYTAVCLESTQRGAVVSSEGARCHYGHATRAWHVSWQVFSSVCTRKPMRSARDCNYEEHQRHGLATAAQLRQLCQEISTTLDDYFVYTSLEVLKCIINSVSVSTQSPMTASEHSSPSPILLPSRPMVRCACACDAPLAHFAQILLQRIYHRIYAACATSPKKPGSGHLQVNSHAVSVLWRQYW